MEQLTEIHNTILRSIRNVLFAIALIATSNIVLYL